MSNVNCDTTTIMKVFYFYVLFFGVALPASFPIERAFRHLLGRRKSGIGGEQDRELEEHGWGRRDGERERGRGGGEWI